MACERLLLGWDRLPLQLAVEWFADAHGPDLGALVVATPGARAGRRLREQLARRLGSSWVPPRILTAGALTDELLTLEARPAGRLARTLAWEEALRGLSSSALSRIVAEAPEPEDTAGWRNLAGEVRSLFGELAADGLDFADVAEGPAREAKGGGERGRWQALAQAQENMVRALEREGLCDPHLGRRAALEARRVRQAHVVLLGVPELNRLTRRLLEQLDRVQALVFAPSDRGPAFDGFGCVVPEVWSEASTSLSMDQWHVVEEPVQEARQAIECLAAFGPERFAPEEITLGVADESVTPYLERQLMAHDLVPRDAVGRLVRTTPVGRLLEGIRDLLRRPIFQPWSALLRHPDLERLLRRDPVLAKASPAHLADEYAAEQAPFLVGDEWHGDPEEERSRERRERMEALGRRLHEVLGELTDEVSRSTRSWAGPLRRFLERIYGKRPFDPESNLAHWNQVEALRAIGSALMELEELPAGLAPECRSSEAIDLLLAELSGVRVPPRPPAIVARMATQATPVVQPGLFDEPEVEEASAGARVIELLGWLELPLDEAPALVVTGFDEGRVPDTQRGDAWLSDSMRVTLGLADNAQRLARDLYATEVLCHSREVAFVSGRRTVDGDPVLPSRIAFLRPPEEVPLRVRHALLQDASAVSSVFEGVEPYEPPFLPGQGEEPKAWSATALRDYLASPYYFWLTRCLRKKTWADGERELTPLAFGNLAHKVLEDFGRSDLRHSEDEAAIAGYLRQRLEVRVAERFGREAEPAVRLQVEQLEYRLALFAEKQAREARDGWRIEHVEWVPEQLTLDLGGGEVAEFSEYTRIDRIDRHVDGRRWRILDYKTGEKGNDPEYVHRDRRSGRWFNVQLPMYAWLARDLVGAGTMEVGFVILGARSADIGFRMADWESEVIDEGVDEARKVIREVRRKLATGERFETLGYRPFDAIFRGILGEGLVGDVAPLEGDNQ